MKEEKVMQLGNSGVVFEPVAHTYTAPSGKQLSGITALIREKLFPHAHDGISQAKLDAAAERGTAVHKLCELLDTKGEAEHKNPQYMKAAVQYSTLRNRGGFYAIANEYCVTDEFVYATNIDCVWARNPYGNEVVLADIKTTYELNTEYLSWQLSVNAFLFERQNPHLKVTELYGAWLPFRKDKFAPSLARLQRIPRKSDEMVQKLLYTDELNVRTETAETMPAIIADDYVAQLIEAGRKMKQYKAQYDAIAEQLKLAMEQNAIKIWDAGEIRATYTAPTSRKSFDSKAFAADYPELYARYCKKTQTNSRVTITIRDN